MNSFVGLSMYLYNSVCLTQFFFISSSFWHSVQMRILNKIISVLTRHTFDKAAPLIWALLVCIAKFLQISFKKSKH